MKKNADLVTKAYLNDAVDHILGVMGQLLQEFKQDMVNHFQKLELERFRTPN